MSRSSDSGADASHITLRLPRNTLKIAGIAFGAGLLLFLLVWATSRKNDFYRADPAVAPAAQSGAPIAPLPEPLPAGGDGASDMPDAKAPPAEPEAAPRLVETPPPAPAPVPMPAPVQDTAPTASLAPGDRPVPIPGQSPAPRYPPAALRRGDQGTVVVRVEVDASGAPGGVALVERSGSRDLDRAAMEAVRAWRFQPAQRDGHAVAGALEIPFDFKPAQ
ncbi:energy transducer TonB [Stenotrophomonas sp. HITSZ_GD]|uniref:energy transducer TonB n=1 Tax=Stenotrophomonas sp. HITSZ_GD TaxID=3037248 RepID=UPI00240D67DC|nr:energy transducer TonB [Stenotrophomonas sp. HITSZ_GD]MDG2526609.1 energy transducer TonB [Stenotrophomonas sp. HITSZ_GD]